MNVSKTDRSTFIWTLKCLFDWQDHLPISPLNNYKHGSTEKDDIDDNAKSQTMGLQKTTEHIIINEIQVNKI